jgi:hypothetical protein
MPGNKTASILTSKKLGDRRTYSSLGTELFAVEMRIEVIDPFQRTNNGILMRRVDINVHNTFEFMTC